MNYKIHNEFQNNFCPDNQKLSIKKNSYMHVKNLKKLNMIKILL